MASRYKLFLRICEQWPIDKTKAGRDLGVIVRQKVLKAFPKGEATRIHDEVECDTIFLNLQKIVTNHSKNKYPRAKNIGCTGLPVDVLREVQSTEVLEEYGTKIKLG